MVAYPITPMRIGCKLGWCRMYLEREIEPAAFGWRRVVFCTHHRRRFRRSVDLEWWRKATQGVESTSWLSRKDKPQ